MYLGPLLDPFGNKTPMIMEDEKRITTRILAFRRDVRHNLYAMSGLPRYTCTVLVKRLTEAQKRALSIIYTWKYDLGSIANLPPLEILS